MISKEEFLKKVNEDPEYAPGWDAIDAAFAEVYGDIRPAHYGTPVNDRAWLGGNMYLDGISFYPSPKGYRHVVTYGMTILYGEEDKYGGDYNGWGYEMTMKLSENNTESCLWVANVLMNLARHTFQTGSYLRPDKYIYGGSAPVHAGTDTKITSLLTVYDTEVKTQETVYGKTEFIQLVGITKSEADAVRRNPERIPELIRLMKADGNPDLVTDMKRTKSYM